jgi:hypothetical protein
MYNSSTFIKYWINYRISMKFRIEMSALKVEERILGLVLVSQI